MSSSESADVLIVGAGPTGLLLGLELMRHGVRPRIVERRHQPRVGSRATDIHSRTLELLSAHGLVDEMLARGKKVRAFNAFANGRRLSRLDFASLDSPYPWTIALQQSTTEQILERRLIELGGRVERGVSLRGLSQVGAGVRVLLQHGAARPSMHSHRFVVGADGLGSSVRQALGLPFRGITYPQPYLVADLSADWDLADDEVHLFMHPEGFFNVVALPGPSTCVRVLADLPCDAPRDPSLATLRQLLARRTHLRARVGESTFLRTFQIQRRLASTFRVGMVLLAGDAAHTCSPLLGQGMNLGLHDAINLGWKLAAILRDGCSTRLLDSYEAERRPHARTTLAVTDALHRLSRLGPRPSRTLRDALSWGASQLPPARRFAARLCAEHGVHYRDSTIVSHASGPAQHGPRAGERAPVLDDHPALQRASTHLLLVFVGRDQLDSPAALTSLIDATKGRGPAGMVVVLVGREGEGSTGDVQRLGDRDGRVHAAFAAQPGTVVLIRPDGYVGHRSERLEPDALRRYFEGLHD